MSVIAAERTLARKRTTITTTNRAAVTKRIDDVRDRDFNEVGLPEDQAVDDHAARQLLLERIELAIESRRQLDRVGVRLLLHSHDHCGRAVSRPLASFEGSAFAHVGDVAYQHVPIAAKSDDAVADFVRRADSTDRLQHVLLWPLHVDAGRRVLARATHRIEELRDGDVVGAELSRGGR